MQWNRPDYCISGDVNGPDNKDIIGAAAHSDYGMLTLLATDGTPGLQAWGFFSQVQIDEFT
jgi:isopenicillin N synthase-like dioxygenase